LPWCGVCAATPQIRPRAPKNRNRTCPKRTIGTLDASMTLSTAAGLTKLRSISAYICRSLVRGLVEASTLPKESLRRVINSGPRRTARPEQTMVPSPGSVIARGTARERINGPRGEGRK
jgi:hypothetical protein